MEKNVNGMVNQMNKLSASFSGFKIVSLVAIVCMFLTAVASFYLYTKKVSELDSRIYIIDGGNAVSASAQDQTVTRRDEVRAHVELFHNYMFNLPPSRDMITISLNKAFELADNSAYRYYNDIQEKGFYRRLTSTNSYQMIEIQDIDIDMNTYPYLVVVRAVQYINRESNVSKYNFVSRCRVANAIRSPRNLNGLMIENFEVIENGLIETRNK